MSVITPTRIEDRYSTRQSTESALLRRVDPVVHGSVEDGPLNQADLDSVDRSGFASVDEIITLDEVDEYRTELDRLSADTRVRADERTVAEAGFDDPRCIFEIHQISEVFAKLVRDPRVVGPARQLLGSEVYVHQARADLKPGFEGPGFYWRSDFETWHAEDGMPAPRAVSVSVALTPNYPTNGCLMIMPGSHRTFVSCVGEAAAHPDNTSGGSLPIGTPDQVGLSTLVENGITQLPGPAGSATIFDANCMYGSTDNITPYPRSNVVIVFNSTENPLVEPFAADAPRAEYLASRDFTPVR